MLKDKTQTCIGSFFISGGWKKLLNVIEGDFMGKNGCSSTPQWSTLLVYLRTQNRGGRDHLGFNSFTSFQFEDSLTGYPIETLSGWKLNY